MSSEGSWLPDNQRLVVWDKEDERLAIASLDGAALEHFSIDAPGCNSALFSADESLVAISCDDGIYLAHERNGQGAQRVVENTEPENWVHLVAWENTGTKLLFIGSSTMLETASRGSASDEAIWSALYDFNVNTGQTTRLTDSAHEILGAAWVIVN